MFSTQTFGPQHNVSSPFQDDDEDDFDSEDPHFQPSARSRAHSIEDLGILGGFHPLASLNEQDTHLSRASLPRTSDSSSPNIDNMDVRRNGVGSPGRLSRTASSPSRPHLTALSPLQAFSPLQAVAAESKEIPLTVDTANTRPLGRSSSHKLSRSLSGRERVYVQAAEHRRGSVTENTPTGTARLILVKAPVSKDVPLRQRSKSSSALAPFSAFVAAMDTPATSVRGPRRSFAASSFSSFQPMSPVQPSSIISGDADSQFRAASTYAPEVEREGRKPLSPEEVLELARGLMSPVAVTRGEQTGANLKRRKSTGATNMTKESEPIALEPVEYVQMDEKTLLPFAERPREVAELLSNAVNEKLVSLLKAALPKTPIRADWKEREPIEWSWDELYAHLTTVDRVECPDYGWVLLAREAVRKHSVALWEKLGVCLGCDTELLTAGDEDESPSWGGLNLAEEDDYDTSLSRVFIEGLEPINQYDTEQAERDLLAEFGEPVEDDGSAGWLSTSMATIGEGEEESSLGVPALTTAQRAGNSAKIDPFSSLSAERSPGRRSTSRSPRGGSVFASSLASTAEPASLDSVRGLTAPDNKRTKSFVGLQIVTSPMAPPSPNLVRSPIALNSAIPIQPQFERGPGNPMFVSSFNSLSLKPNLGRSNSVTGDGKVMPMAATLDDFNAFRSGERKWHSLGRKASGAGLSESAITFASESEVGSHHD